ncbi:MAG: hypothetical protein LC672_01590 [Acidobacteria bacterium]|nr:hypothetical protein [Acidobacteriota bacterium]
MRARLSAQKILTSESAEAAWAAKNMTKALNACGGIISKGNATSCAASSRRSFADSLLSESGSNVTVNGNTLPNAAGARTLGTTALP